MEPKLSDFDRNLSSCLRQASSGCASFLDSGLRRDDEAEFLSVKSVILGGRPESV